MAFWPTFWSAAFLVGGLMSMGMGLWMMRYNATIAYTEFAFATAMIIVAVATFLMMRRKTAPP